MVRRILVSAAMLSVLSATAAKADFMPQNSLYLEDTFEHVQNLTEAQFNETNARARVIFEPIVTALGGRLTIRANWNDSTVNASANQSFGSWVVNMYGGLARRSEVTPDGFVLVLCHEIGHHLGGFPFVSSWAANEGQADYFATTHCAQKYWGEEREINALSRDLIPAGPKSLCDDQWSTEDAQNLCYRTALAGKSLADLLGALGDTTASFDTPDTSVVDQTDDEHPAAQCRLDTYLAGALCSADYVTAIIPGKSFGSGRNGRPAEEESAQHYCASRDGFREAARSTCWFHPAI